MKKTIFILGALSILLGMVWVRYKPEEKQKTVIKIGVVQDSTHSAIEEARQGFIDELSSDLGIGVEFVVMNSEGDPAVLKEIVHAFHEDESIRAMYAIATPAAKAAIEAEAYKPIFVSAITNPEVLREQPSRDNVCGASDEVQMSSLVEMMNTLLPDIKKVAVLNTEGDEASIYSLQDLKKILTIWGIECDVLSIQTRADLPKTLGKIFIEGAEAIILPTDNVLAKSMPYIASEARQKGVPVFTTNTSGIEDGVLASCGVNYYEQGKRSAQLARQVLLAKVSPNKFKIQKSEEIEFYINKAVLNQLGLIAPEGLEKVKLL